MSSSDHGRESRPTRSVQEWRDGVTLAAFPAIAEPHHRPVDPEAHRALRNRVGDLDPQRR